MVEDKKEEEKQGGLLNFSLSCLWYTYPFLVGQIQMLPAHKLTHRKQTWLSWRYVVKLMNHLTHYEACNGY